MTRAIQRLAIFAMLPLLIAADHDTSKLPEGSVWVGTYKIRNKKELIFSSGIELKIVKREKADFVGQWTQLEQGVTFEVKGTLNGNKVSFSFGRVIKGKAGNAAVIGGRVASGVIAVHEKETKLSGTTANPDKPDSSGTWEATLKTGD